MLGLEQFLNKFGAVTLLDIVELGLAAVFVFVVIKKVGTYLLQRHDAEVEKDKQIKTALEAVSHYPEYRKQSLEIQETFKREIAELRKMQDEHTKQLIEMEQANKKRECNKLRDILLQNYRHYTNKELNPSQSWTRMESEAFWELYGDYEDMGGNGHMHSVVRPAMEKLHIVEIDDK